MELGSIFLILALLVMVALFVGRPLFEHEKIVPAPIEESQADHERSTLLADRDRIVNALQELDFDYNLGKIPEEDYPQQRASLMQRGADVLRKLDMLEPGKASGEDAEAYLETVIAARRAGVPQGSNGTAVQVAVPAAIYTPDDDVEVVLASRRRVRQEKAAGFCPKCGGALQKSDRFCPKCGAKIG
jgi:hypothetical protein